MTTTLDRGAPSRRSEVQLPEHLLQAEYVYLPVDSSEFGPVWLADDEFVVDGTISADDLARGRSAELVVDLDDRHGHYLTAVWLNAAAELIEAVQVTGRPVDLSHPEYYLLRDRAERLKADAVDASAVYYAHNSLRCDLTAAQLSDDDTECTAGCWCGQRVHEVGEETEQLLADLGYVTQWHGGVQVFYVGGERS